MSAKRCLALLALLVLVGSLAGCASSPPPRGVTIMTFNVQNLFDTVDDPGKDDKAYLPIEKKSSAAHIAECHAIEVQSWRQECLELDWDEALLAKKLSVIAATIRQVDSGPDIIAFQEVEHASLLDRLRLEYLAELGYGPAILIEGTDLRGIDTGFLSKLPLADPPVLHPLHFPNQPEREADTRGILEATFVLPDDSKLTGFAVHFPAPFHPTAMRERAYAELNALRNDVPRANAVFAAGDFNTTSTEADATGILDRRVRPYWTIAHDISCNGCRGTYYYARDDNWSFLDMILYSPARGENTTWAIRADSVRVANDFPAQGAANDRPLRFDPVAGTGVSDHWPLLVTIEPKQKQ